MCRFWIASGLSGMARTLTWFDAPAFFLLGYRKDKVYAHSLHNVAELQYAITVEFNAIPPAFCREACKNVSLCLQACSDLDGQQVNHTLENRA